MSISSLVNISVPAYTGNYTKGREGKKISEITLHHMAGRLTAKRCGELFQAVGRKGSSHYGIGYDGLIANYVDEDDTAWANSNWDANCRAVTIETANDANGGNWPVNDITLQSLIRLVADIASRNGLVPLVKGKNFTWHQMYSATACPGPYLLGKLDYIVEEANKLINSGSDVIITTTPVNVTYQTYTNRWLGNISQHNPNDPKNGYAGVFGESITGVYVDASVGNVYYRVHVKGGNWLPEVKNREDYAGILGKPIDAIMIRSDSTTIHYKAHDKTRGWLGDVTGYNENDGQNGYAGWFGYQLDGLMVWADPIVKTTIVEKPKPVQPVQPIQPVKQQLYRVRLSWEDAKSQLSAWSNLDSAIQNCPSGYNVYDIDGNVVHTNPAIVVPDNKKEEPKVEPEQTVNDSLPNVDNTVIDNNESNVQPDNNNNEINPEQDVKEDIKEDVVIDDNTSDVNDEEDLDDIYDTIDDEIDIEGNENLISVIVKITIKVLKNLWKKK